MVFEIALKVNNNLRELLICFTLSRSLVEFGFDINLENLALITNILKAVPPVNYWVVAKKFHEREQFKVFVGSNDETVHENRSYELVLNKGK